jgi:EmrB/QacA subfamily drug resistance transporter
VLKLAFTTYLLSLTVFIPNSGWMADRFGARNIFRAAILVFTLGSVACGLSQSLGGLVAARALQGIGGAMMVPVGRIILLRSTPKSQLVDALAWLTIPALLGPLVGPPIGGFITTYINWRLIFFMNVPFGLAAIAFATWRMPKITAGHVPPLDVRGFLLSGLGLSATVFGLTVMGRDLLPGAVPALLVFFGIVVIGLYLRHARKAPAPILDLRLLRTDTFRAGVIGGSLFRVGVGAVPFLMPLLFQLGFGLSAFQSGLITCAAALGAISMKFGASRLIRRFGFRLLLIRNGLAASATIAAMALFTPATPFAVIVGLLILGGFLRSLQFTAMNAMSYADIDNGAMSHATSLYTVVQQLSLAAGVVTAAFMLELAQFMRGDATITANDFAYAFAVVGAIAATSIWTFTRLAPDAGASVSGRT